MSVDLPAQTVIAPDGAAVRFEINAFQQGLVPTGQDELALTGGYEAQIRQFEERQAREIPWLSERYRA